MPTKIKSDLILAGDIGGTKTNLALFDLKAVQKGHFKILKNKRYPSGEFPSLLAILNEFLDGKTDEILAAGFGIAGPVEDGKVNPSNITWAVDSREIAEKLDLQSVALLNDLAANAYGISTLGAKDFETVQKGNPAAKGNCCIVSPGTGLGEAGLFWNGKAHDVWASEGGHSNFAPRNDLEIDLLQHLMKQFGHVSYERVASGIGIENIYRFLHDTGRGKELPEVAAAMQKESAGVVISRFDQAGTCPMCSQTLDIFTSCLGAECGNMALKSFATGGVYLGGGIPAKLIKRMKSAAFLHAFNEKGRMRSIMQEMPIKIILNDNAALFGAAKQAAISLG
ncbi:MAG: glucokinase [Chthoniobacterales bacterium]